jgi:hypothetical protein
MAWVATAMAGFAMNAVALAFFLFGRPLFTQKRVNLWITTPLAVRMTCL